MDAYHSHVINVLIQFFLDKDAMRVYHMRWDTWLITKSYMSEYFYLMMKTDFQIANILREAREKSLEIKSSPLAKALSEEE